MSSFQWPPISGTGGGGSGTVTSVGLTLPSSVFSVFGSPVTASGSLSGLFINQPINTVFASPASGGSGVPVFRGLVLADLPAGTGTVLSVTASSPLFSSGGQNPNLTIQVANSTQNGYLSSSDWSTFNNKQPAGSYVLTSEVGAPNGVASLDSGGKVPLTQLPAAVITFQGTWDPSTNTPFLSDGTGTNGFLYWVNANFAGPIAGLNNPSMVNFVVGEIIIYSSAIGQWQKSSPAAGVVSVNGFTGVVTVDAINELTGDVIAGPASGSQSQVASLVATSNSTLTTLSALSLPGSQVLGDIPGNAANITATSNLTLTSIPSLTLPATQLSGQVLVANGGTSQSSLALNNVILGNGTSPVQFVAPGTPGNILADNGTTWVSQAPSSVFSPWNAQSTSYMVLASDSTIGFTTGASTLTATLPTAVGASGKSIFIQKVDSGTGIVLIATVSGQTVGTRPSNDIALYVMSDYIKVVSDGANWQIEDKVETQVIFSTPTDTGFNVIGNSNFGALAGNAVTLGIGKWRITGFFTTWTDGLTNNFVRSNSGFYAANGANNASTPAALVGAVGPTTFTALGAGGVTGNGNLANFQFSTSSNITFTLVNSSSQTVYLVPVVNAQGGAGATINAQVIAERIW